MEKILRPDIKGRLHLGALAKGVSSYRVTQDGDRLMLEPFVEVPAREQWLHQNPEAFASLSRGLADADAGRIVYRGRRAEHPTDEENVP